jgi:hypothetical protein
MPSGSTATPLHPSVVETLEWLFPERKRLTEPGAAPADARYLKVSSAYLSPLYRALYAQWLDESRNTLWMAGSPIVADAIDREHGRLQGPLNGLSAAVSRHQPALARPEARVRLQAGRARRSARPGPRLARTRIDPHDRALRQPETGGTSGSRRTAGRRQNVRPEDRSCGQTFKNLSRSHRTELRSKRRPRQGIRYKSLTDCGMESWYRYGDSNPGPVAENHVS